MENVVSLNLYNITLLKLEILKSILVYKFYTYKNINIEKSFNFFLSLNFNFKEINILKKNKNNKLFNYDTIKHNKVFISILKFICLKNKNLNIENNNLIEYFLAIELNPIQYKIFYNHLQNIKNNYNMILKKNIIEIKLDYIKIIDLYEIIFKNNLISENILIIDLTPYNIINNCEIFKNNFSQIEIIKEKKKIYKKKIILKRYECDSIIYQNQIEFFNSINLLKNNAEKYINADDDIKPKLLNNLNNLENKIL